MHKHYLKANEDNCSSSSSTNIKCAIRPATRSQNNNHENNPSMITSSRSIGKLVNYISHFRLETLQSSLTKNAFHRTDDRKLVKQVKDKIDETKKHVLNDLNFDSIFTQKKNRNYVHKSLWQH